MTVVVPLHVSPTLPIIPLLPDPPHHYWISFLFLRPSPPFFFLRLAPFPKSAQFEQHHQQPLSMGLKPLTPSQIHQIQSQSQPQIFWDNYHQQVSQPSSGICRSEREVHACAGSLLQVQVRERRKGGENEGGRFISTNP